MRTAKTYSNWVQVLIFTRIDKSRPDPCRKTPFKWTWSLQKSRPEPLAGRWHGKIPLRVSRFKTKPQKEGGNEDRAGAG
jgi:hypothetical protein